MQMTLSKKKKTKKNNPKSAEPRSQLPDDFVSVARRLGADEDKATFEAKLAKIARTKPKTD
jgi:hypothetical protein